MTIPSQILAFCRGGFEQECRMELETAIGKTGVVVQATAEPGSGYVLLRPKDRKDVPVLLEKISFINLVFARHLVAIDDGTPLLTPGDRLGPLRSRLQALAQQHTGTFSAVWLGWPDNAESRVLAPLCRTLAGRLDEDLRADNVLDPQSGGSRGEVVFFSGTRVSTGFSLPYNSGRWPMGLPRLRLPPGSPSRSALKLEEALTWFSEHGPLHRPVLSGQTAVDLGAAPGGWTWAMARRGVAVTAVDRGSLADHVRSSPLVRHVRDDGFRFRPQFNPDWLLCDIIDKPRKVADLVAHWVDNRWCHNALFNLKLPMKKRLEEVLLCRERITVPLRRSKRPFQLYFRQLYHDREEVTGLLKLGK